METIPVIGTRRTIRDHEGAAVGRTLAQEDSEAQAPSKTDDEILAHLDHVIATEMVAGMEAGGWAQEACLRAYRAAYRSPGQQRIAAEDAERTEIARRARRVVR